MSRSLIKILSIILMTLVLTTCKPSPINGGEGTSEGQDDGYIMLVFNEKKSANRDTSPDTDTESALSHLDVMMYKYNEDNYTYEPFYHERVDVTQYPDGSAYLNKKKDDFEPFAKYKIYVVANSTHSESVFKPEGTAVISHENLMKLDQTDENIHLSGIKGGNDVYPQYFLMDGVAYMGENEPNNPGTIVINDDELDNIVLKVKLRRATAKYVIKIYPGENVEFTQQMLAQSKGYMMRNMPIRTRVVAEGKYPNNNPAYWKSSILSQSPYFEYVQEDNNKYHLRVTLYCYSHRWNSAEFFDKGTSFVFMLPIVYSDDKGEKTEYINNYYQLVLNKKETGQEYEHIIKRNTFYELRVKLNAPGAEDFTVPEELEDIHYFTAPWTEKELNIDGESTVAYLKVNKDKLYMYNIAKDNTSLYFSSSSPVTTEIVSDSVYYYNKYGVKTTVDLNKQKISATADAVNKSGNIIVNSDIPTNNTILYFTIKLTNQEGLSELIEVEQYPLIYVTNMLPWYSYREDYYYRKTDGHNFDSNCSTDRDTKNLPTTYSYGGDRIASVHVSSVSSNGTIKYTYNRKGDKGSSGFFSSKYRSSASGTSYKNNFYYYTTNGKLDNDDNCETSNLRNYHIRVMASSDKYTLGRPRIDENGYTASDEENAKLVSPSFVIASRLGAVYSTSGGLSNLDLNQKLIVFADHAKNYVEVDDIDDKKNANNVVVYDNWRLPTRAEIEIIIELQGKSGENAAAVDYLLNGAYYMSASGPVFNPKNSNGVKETDESKKNDVAIRCVRDVYYE